VDTYQRVITNFTEDVVFQVHQMGNVRFIGPLYANWEANRYYSFRLRAYADAEHLHPLDTFEQPSLCTVPDKSVLDQLPEQ
jgi:hypothetical protein